MTCCLCSRSVRVPAPNRKWPLSCSGRLPRGRPSTSGGRHRRQTLTWTAGWKRWTGHVVDHTPSARRVDRVYIAAYPAAMRTTHEGRWNRLLRVCLAVLVQCSSVLLEITKIIYKIHCIKNIIILEINSVIRITHT